MAQYGSIWADVPHSLTPTYMVLLDAHGSCSYLLLVLLSRFLDTNINGGDRCWWFLPAAAAGGSACC